VLIAESLEVLADLCMKRERGFQGEVGGSEKWLDERVICFLGGLCRRQERVEQTAHVFMA
jgi:hypothetical protein